MALPDWKRWLGLESKASELAPSPAPDQERQLFFDALLMPNEEATPKVALPTRSSQTNSDISLPVTVEITTKRRSATARRTADGLLIQVPHRWSLKTRTEAIESLQRRLEKAEKQRLALIEQAFKQGPLVQVNSQQALRDLVFTINNHTFQAELSTIKVGWAKHSRLAQINLKTRGLTISRYCLGTVPEPALRYLIVHELAHTLEGGHNRRFWKLVETYCADYRKQHKVMAAIHQEAVLQADPGYVSPEAIPSLGLLN